MLRNRGARTCYPEVLAMFRPQPYRDQAQRRRGPARGPRAVLAVLVASALVVGGAPAASASAKDVDVKTSSRASVARAYNSVLAPALRVPTGWTGSVGKCRRGKESAASRRATRDAINFVRALNQLEPVKLDKRLNKRALRAALMMQANGALSHNPTRAAFSSCFSQAGRKAAARSNLYLSWGSRGDRRPSTGARAIVGYMTDAGEGNLPVGHRRWILNPTTRVMATGSTRSANALTVIGTERNHRAKQPRFLEWPSRGWFPTQLEPEGRWSLSTSRPGISLRDAKVKVRQVNAKGKVVRKLKTRRHAVQDGFGPHTLVFTVQGVRKPKGKKTVRYRVTVSGIKGAKKKRISYTVRLFDPTRF